MECHKCPNREKIENGEFAKVAYSNTPCAKCHLNENSDLTMEYVQDMESRIQNPPSSAEATAGMVSRMGDDEAQTSDISHLPEEEVLPVSVMSEVVFRLLSMTPETRDTVCWRFAGMSYQDIAILQGVTVAAVEKRHWKAMKKWPALRAMFATKVAKHGRRKSVGSGQKTVDTKFERNANKTTGKRVAFEKRNG
jgi:hypothetical protein